MALDSAMRGTLIQCIFDSKLHPWETGSGSFTLHLLVKTARGAPVLFLLLIISSAPTSSV